MGAVEMMSLPETTTTKRVLTMKAKMRFWSVVGVVAGFVSLAGCKGEGSCWGDLQTGATYQLTLLPKAIPETHYTSGYSESPSCSGIDNLTTGSMIDIQIPQSSQHLDDRGYCWAPEGFVTSDIGLQLTGTDPFLPDSAGFEGNEPMFFVSGRFTSGTCTGRWGFEAFDKGADTYNGTPAYKWAGRIIEPDPTPDCQAAFPTLFGANFSYCHDDWDADVQKL
jgi:hypothetical protein